VLAQLWTLGGHAFIVTDADEVPQDDPHDPMLTAMRQAQPVGDLQRAGLGVVPDQPTQLVPIVPAPGPDLLLLVGQPEAILQLLARADPQVSG
jgi:hypothetical protein